MITQVQQQLSSINRAYFEGQLTFADYRKRRGALLDSMYESSVIDDDMDSDTVPMNNPVAQSTTANKSSHKFIYITIFLLLTAIAIAASFLLPSTPISTPTRAPSTSPEMITVEHDDSLQILIEENLASDNWTPVQIEQIDSLWRGMSPEQRAIARQQDWFLKLTGRLDTLLSEQKTQIESGNPDAAVFERQITALEELLENK